MAKELPILPSTAQPGDAAQAELYQCSRVFCQKENSPPLRLLVEFLKSHGQTPITPPDMDDTMLDEWAWVQVTLGYDRNRKPIQVFCSRDRGSYQDVFEKEKELFLGVLSGWILEFYQDQCNGIVQIDNQGFYSPKGDLIVDLSIKVE